MLNWQRFLDSFDSPGGHLLMLVAGVLLGCALAYVGVVDGHTVLIGSGGALLALLKRS